MLAKQEEEQYRVASTFSPIPIKLNAPVDLGPQRSRETNAKPFLCDVSEESALGNLNTYCKKTKVNCTEVFSKGTVDNRLTLTYQSLTRMVSAVGVGSSKKTSKRKAAFNMLRNIKASIREKQGMATGK